MTNEAEVKELKPARKPRVQKDKDSKAEPKVHKLKQDEPVTPEEGDFLEVPAEIPTEPEPELPPIEEDAENDAVPVHILEKAGFINSILENARVAMLGTIKDMPEYWTGRELRLYMSDYFAKYVVQQVPPATKQRYRKDCANRPLL